MMKADAGSEVFRLLAILGLAATLLLLPTHSRAQGETTSSILGEITDTSNAALAGATDVSDLAHVIFRGWSDDKSTLFFSVDGEERMLPVSAVEKR